MSLEHDDSEKWSKNEYEDDRNIIEEVSDPPSPESDLLSNKRLSCSRADGGLVSYCLIGNEENEHEEDDEMNDSAGGEENDEEKKKGAIAKNDQTKEKNNEDDGDKETKEKNNEDDGDKEMKEKSNEDINYKGTKEEGSGDDNHEVPKEMAKGDDGDKETTKEGSGDDNDKGTKEEDNRDDNDKGTREEADGEDMDVPIDRGWAWVVLTGSWLNIALMMGYLRGLSVLFVEYLRVYNASAAKTTLLMGVTAAVTSVSALFSLHILVDRFGSRKTVFLGGTLSVAGLACAIAPINIDFIIGTHSILLGMGNAMIFGPSIVPVGIYFNKRRGFASAVAMSGVSMGGMIFPPMIRYFLDEYGLQGTMILLTGINMNTYVGASVFWPLESFKKRKSKETQEYQPLNRLEKQSFEKPLQSQSAPITSKSSDVRTDSGIHSESAIMSHGRLRPESTGSNLSRSSKNVLFYASQTFGSVLSIPREDIPDRYQKRTLCDVFSALDFSLFKRPMFIFVVSYSFFCVTSYQTGAYLPALSSEKGINKQEAALFLTVMGAIDLVCRFLLGFLMDTRIIRVNVIMAIGMLVNGTGSFFTYFYNSYATLLMFACINGLSTCTYFGIIPVGIIEFIGIDNLAKTLGFVVLFHGLSDAIVNPLIGGIRDATGSYVGAYLYLGVSTYIGATLLLCEPLARRYAERKSRTRQELDVESEPLNSGENENE